MTIRPETVRLWSPEAPNLYDFSIVTETDKVESYFALRRIDTRVVAPLLDRLGDIDPAFRILLLSDHPTLVSTRCHDGDAVPFAIYDSTNPGTPRKFDEDGAKATGDFMQEGPMLLKALFA